MGAVYRDPTEHDQAHRWINCEPQGKGRYTAPQETQDSIYRAIIPS